MEPHVAEDEDLEKLKSWWKTNGTSILVGIALGLGGLGGYNGWVFYTESQAESASNLFSQFRVAVNDEKPESAALLAGELREDYAGSPYTASAQLILARDQFQAGDATAARDSLNWVISNADDISLKHTARLRLAYIELAEGNGQKALDLLSTDSVEGFTSQYAELKADAHASLGEIEKARAKYDEAINSLPAGSAYMDILKAKQAGL